jgi:hypothetical protein
LDCKWQLHSVDNYGAFQIIDPFHNPIVAGEKFDLDAAEVVDYCRGLEEEPDA